MVKYRQNIVLDLFVFNIFATFGIGLQGITVTESNINSAKSGLHEFDLFIKNTLKCRNIPAISISMVKDSHVIFSRGYGYSNIEDGTKATEHTKFSIGSLTKAFTTAIIADILSKHKNITWDTPLRQILSTSFRLSDDLRTNNANLRDLLAHKIGTPSNFHPLLVGFPASCSRRDLVRKLQYMPAVSDFRTEFHYSNYMYMLAGYVAEEITGESWENLVKTRLFDKLGMRDSGFVDQPNGLHGMPLPYVVKNKKIVRVDKNLLLAVSPSGPAGSIYSTASDMAKWMLFNLHKGRKGHGQGHEIVKEKYLEETFKSQMTHPFADKDLTKPKYPISDVSISYNMGWMSSIYRGYHKLWHSGGIVTFTSQIWLFPDVGGGVFVTASGPMSNQGASAIKMLTAMASDILLDLPPWLNHTTACTFPAPWDKLPDLDIADKDPEFSWNISRPMSDYVGVFGHPGFGNITIKVEAETQLVLFFGRFGKMRLQQAFGWIETAFNGFYVDKLWFITNSDYNTRPIRMHFVVTSDKSDKSSQIKGLRFPVDFEQKKTLFTRDFKYEEITTEDRSSAYTSPVCNSGFETCTASSSLCLIVVVFTLTLLNKDRVV